MLFNIRLENTLAKYACVAENDVIVVKHNGVEYKVEILECKPESAIAVIDTDVTIDFARAKDYSPTKSEVKTIFNGDKEEIKVNKKASVKFPGKGVAVKSRKRAAPFDDDKPEPKVSYDPRKHRINYVKAGPINDKTFAGRCFDSSGTKKFKADDN